MEKIRCDICHRPTEATEVKLKDNPGTTITLYTCDACMAKLMAVDAADMGDK